MKWFHRRQPTASREAVEAREVSEIHLEQAKELRREVAQVSSSLRQSREANHYAEGFWQAMGGRPA